jgi:Na+/phosphate symporter
VFVGVAIFMVIRTQLLFRKRAANKVIEEEDAISEDDAIELIIAKSTKQITKGLSNPQNILEVGLNSFLAEDRLGLRKAEEACKTLSKKAKRNKDRVFKIAQKLMDNSAETTHFYAQMVEHKREMAHAIHFMLDPMITHVENNHKPFTSEQGEELSEVIKSLNHFLNNILDTVQNESFEKLDNLIEEKDSIIELLRNVEKSQFKRVKQQLVNTRNSQLFFKMNAEMEKLVLHAINLVKSQRDFITNTRQVK